MTAAVKFQITTESTGALLLKILQHLTSDKLPFNQPDSLLLLIRRGGKMTQSTLLQMLVNFNGLFDL